MGKLNEGDKYWRLCPSVRGSFSLSEEVWIGDSIDRGYYADGLVFLTKDSGQAAVSCLNSILKEHKERLKHENAE